MFVRSTRLDLILSTLFVVAMGACSTGAGCCTTTQPLPGGKLPADQTIEGGAQIRVTQQGFTKITQVMPGLLNSSFANGFCIGQGSLSFVDYCNTNQGGACGAGHGCKVSVGIHPSSFAVSVTSSKKLNLRMGLDVHTSVPISAGFIGSCSMNFDGNNLAIDADIAFSINATTGELEMHLATINSFDVNGLSISNCGIVSDILSIVGDIVATIENSFLAPLVNQLLAPAFDSIIQGILPNPLGVAGMVDIGGLLAGVSPGTEGSMEARVVPGGYVDLENGGMSLGVITGINADEDITTRTPDLDSEPARCVPPIPAPNFGAPPANLPISSRSTFQLLPADAFKGVPTEVPADVAMGISETTLDLLGHHLVTSGGMCLGVGTPLINQLNVGTIGILVPSLSELGHDDGKDPLLLVTRPQQALDFEIGDNTDASPGLSIHANHIEVDLYAFLYERYTRALTLDLTMTIGLKLEFVDVAGKTVIRPTLKGINSQSVTVKVLNSQFVRETPAELEQVLPAVFDLVASQLGTLPDIDVPAFAGFSLNNLSIKKVMTAQDDFLALFANLGASAMMRTIGDTEPLMADAVRSMDAQVAPLQAHSTATAKLVSVVTPPAEAIRGALRKSATGKLPQITFDTPARDAQGRELEWAYRIDDGMWRSYRETPTPLVISENMLALQGKYTIALQSRVVGDYRTTSDEIATEVIVDSIAPRVLEAKLAWNTSDQLEIPLYDIVSEHALQYGFGAPGADAPTAWTDGAIATIDRAAAEQLAANNELTVFAKDEAGNVASLLIAPFHGQPGGAAGCGCEASHPTSGGVLLVVLVGGVLLGARRRTRASVVRFARTRAATNLGAFLAVAIGSSLAPGCSCGKTAEAVCEVNDDCDAFCPFGQQGICMNNMCSCVLTAGRTGPYSDVAVAGDGTVWVSAYSQTFGDLVVAHWDQGRIPDESWEWVDGVPDVTPTADSSIRGGITEPGPDVGMYTSIAVNSMGVPMVSYFDREHGSLMFAMKVGDAWQKHVVDAGTGIDGEGVSTGLYTSLTLRADDGRPGIAYLAHVTDATGERAEVRYVAAQTAMPTSATDWQAWTVDTAPVIVDPANPEIYPLPGGLGLFIDSARLPTNAPVVVYYDRANGELKLSKLDATTGEFTTPVVLDGSMGDAGWSPSVTVDPAGKVHVAYVSATNDDFKYITDAPGAKPETIDDGYRIVGQSPDGLPKPEYHFVGDDAGLVLPSGGGQPLVVYQDATTQELLLAQRGANGVWTHISIAGHTDPWLGAYGFFAADALSGNELVISSWVIDQPTDQNWVEVFKRPTVIQ